MPHDANTSPDTSLPAAGTGVGVVFAQAESRFRAVRESIDAFNQRLSWLFAFLGVLLVSLSTSAVGFSDVAGFRTTATVALAFILFAVVAAGVASWPVHLYVIDDDHWFSDGGIQGEEREVMAEAALALMAAVRADSMPRFGALAIKSRRFRAAVALAVAATVSVAAASAIGMWA